MFFSGEEVVRFICGEFLYDVVFYRIKIHFHTIHYIFAKKQHNWFRISDFIMAATSYSIAPPVTYF